MIEPFFTVLSRDTEWDFPEINILARSIRGLIFHYDKAPGTIVIPGVYTRDEIVDALGYGTFEHQVVAGYKDIPLCLVADVKDATSKRVPAMA